MQVTSFQPLRKDNERAKPNALYHVQVLNKSVKWHLSVFVLYPLGPPGCWMPTFLSRVTQSTLSRDRGSTLFWCLMATSKKKPAIPSVDQHQVRILRGRSMVKDQVTAVNVLFPHEVLSARNSTVMLFLKVMHCSLLLLTGPLVLKKS